MKNLILSSSIVIASFSFAGVALACDMHGAGYGNFGFSNANWKPYNPKVSTIDPAFADSDMMDATSYTSVPPEKAKPSFSNVASLAALKAKTRLTKKNNEKASSDKADVKKTASNADR
jgi:hypothetical protein